MTKKEIEDKEKSKAEEAPKDKTPVVDATKREERKIFKGLYRFKVFHFGSPSPRYSP